MIYLFNDVKELTGTVRNNHILNLLYEREKNGIYSVSAEVPVTYNDQGTIYNYNKKIQKSDFLGHYDKEGRFQLHKIAAVDIENGSIFVKGIHIFFDEAKAGAIIKDRRFINREIIDGARVAFESIGWSVADFDVSVGKTYNFYNVTPLEARQILVETFGFEFDYWLDFDGKKVTNRHVAVKEKIGEKTSKRYTYGHNVLNIRAEQDYSEIYTAVIGRGKGEEIEETGGYGRRIEYTDVVWSKPSKPLNKPSGTRVLEDPNATQLFGYKENGVVKPRVKVEVFSDIESPTELIQASYDWLMDNNVPKAVFSLKVADGDGLNLGDEVYVIYRDIDLVKSARVEKVIDDLVSGNRDVEFGDTAYFDTDRRLSGLRSDLKRHSGETGDRIYRLKMEFNRRFDEEVSSWVAEFEQNLIDQKAQIEADRENMTNLIEGTRTEFTDNLNAEITQTKEYAEQQAQEKADSVQTNLDSFKESHQQLYDEVTGNILDIDTFLGDKSKTLAKQFSEMESGLSQSITAESGRIDAIVTNFGDSGKSLAQFVLDVDSIETTVAKNDAWLGTYGSAAEQTIAGFEQKVWQSDIHNPNIIPFNNLTLVENRKQWLTRGDDSLSYLDEQEMIRNVSYTSPYNYVQSPYVSLQAGETYTLSFTSLIGSSYNLNDLMHYTYVVYPDRDNVLIKDLMSRELVGSAYSVNIYKFTVTFTAEETTDKARILIGANVLEQGQRSDLFIGKPKLELGDRATLYNNALSIFEQRADELKLAVTDSDGLASVIALSPSAIDLISDKINVTGNLNIKGGVESIAIDAIEGNFARLFASQLTANVIKSTHIQASTTLVDKLFSYSARIDELITKTHFVNSMHALTLDVIDLNASNIRTRLLSANTIEAEWLKSGTALLDKVFASTAMFERMMAKSGFVTTLNTVSIDTDRLTIRRYDGAAIITEGLANFDYNVQLFEFLHDDTISWDGQWYRTQSGSSRRFMIGSFRHSGRYLKFNIMTRLNGSSPLNSEHVIIKVASFGGTLSYNVDFRYLVRRGETGSQEMVVDLGRPTFTPSMFYLELRRDPTSTGNVGNIVQARANRAWIDG